MRKIESLQILRAVAAMLVVVSHAWTWAKPYASGPVFLDSIEFIGGLGVDIFFCLSGFIMMWTISDAAPTLKKGAKFFFRRVQRIYPVYLICLAVMASIAIQPSTIDGGALLYLLRNALLLPGLPSEPEYRMLLSPAWTLVYEMYFYFVFAICVATAPKRYLSQTLAGVLVAIFAVSHFTIGYGDRLGWVNLTHIIGDPLIFNFLVGSLIAHFARGHVETLISKRARWIAISFGVSICATGYFGFPESARMIKFGLPSMAAVALACACKTPTTSITQALEHLGSASYSIYLTHIFAFMLIGATLTHFIANAFIVFTANIALATIVGCAVYSYIERPILQLIRQRRPRLHEPTPLHADS